MPNHTLKGIPDDIHKAWKVAAAYKGVSMLDYCIVALEAQVQKDLKELAGSGVLSDGSNKDE